MTGNGKYSLRRRTILQNNRNVLIRRGLIALDHESIRLARFYFEQAAGYERTPLVLSCLGYCMAMEGEDTERAFALCREAISREPGNPLHHLHLGRVFLLSGRKDLAVTTFGTGLKFGDHPELRAELKRMGMRRPPLFTFLSRHHLLNRCCGFLLTRLGMRFILHPTGSTPWQT